MDIFNGRIGTKVGSAEVVEGVLVVDTNDRDLQRITAAAIQAGGVVIMSTSLEMEDGGVADAGEFVATDDESFWGAFDQYLLGKGFYIGEG